MTRIARILTRPNVGGPTRQVIALWHALRALGARTLLLVGHCGPDEAEIDLSSAGIPEISADAVGRGAVEGWCRVDGLGRRPAPRGDARALRRLRQVLRAYAPDVVHTHTSKAGVLGRLAAPRGALVAHSFHGLVIRDYAGPFASALVRAVERRLARRSDLLFAVSASCRAELQAIGIRRPITVLPPAVDCAPFRTADRAACRARLAAGAAPVIGFVGRLVPIKRPERFVEVARALPEVDAVVLGDGPLREALAATAPPNLRWLGSRDDVAELVPGLDLLVLPSRREGFPVAAIEAAAAGLRSVGFEVPGLVDLAAFPGVATLVPESAGSEGLVAAVRAALATPRAVDAAVVAELAAASAPQRIASELLAAYLAAPRASRGTTARTSCR